MAHIKTYARLKPSRRAYPGYEVDYNTLRIHITDNKEFVVIDPQQVANRGNLSYEVSFTEIFSPESTQEEVFRVAAKDIIQNFLNGYNGTIFAYGQTGTGKTYTVEGNTHQFSSRGLSTRALSMIYQQLARRLDDHISVYLSYLEIYQEVAYDLLNPTSRSTVPMLPFTKVTVCDGSQDSCMLRGLTLHLAASEEVAQMLLLQGQANRKIAETPANQRSSRSHAVFTVYLQARKHDSKVTLKSKLHLVDLAGSERVSKTGADGQQLTEAKSINLSLHHLETVIIALQSDHVLFTNSISGEDKSLDENLLTQSRSVLSVASGPSSDGGRPSRFVPYRNSLLTMLLKDSLGGNCLTAMIATISMEPENLGESVSTCRFAQRVARVANNARRNEEIDDKALISRLKQRILCMKQELASVKSQGRWRTLYSYDDLSVVLSQEAKSECARVMEGFLQGDILDPVSAGICDRYRFLECLHLLKEQCLKTQAALAQLQTAQQQMDNGLGLFSLTECSDYNGDQRTTEVSHPGTLHIAGYQQSPFFTTSEGSIDASEEFYSASDNHAAWLANTDSSTLERKGTESSTSPDIHSEEKYIYPSMRIKLKTDKNMDQVERKPGQEQQEQQAGSDPMEQLKHNIQFQKLLQTENSFRLKLKVLEQQLVDHHVYIQWLKNKQSDPVHIAKELLIEDNQLKCQTRFQEKLNKLIERKAKIMSSVSADRQKCPFIRQCCKKASHYGRSSPCKLKSSAANSKQASPGVDSEKSALRIKDLTFKVAASLNRCGDLKHSLQISPQPADQQPQKTIFPQTDEDVQKTPTALKQYYGQDKQQKTPKVSGERVDQVAQPYPTLSRQLSHQEWLQKTPKKTNQHSAQEQQQKYPAIFRQNARQELQQRSSKIPNQNVDKEQQKYPRIFSQHADQQQQISMISKQHTEKQQNQWFSSNSNDQQNPRISKQADHELKQLIPKTSKQHANQESHQRPPSKQPADHELQQLAPKISKQQANQESHQKSPLKQHAYQESHQKSPSKQPANQESHQKSPSKQANQESHQKSPLQQHANQESLQKSPLQQHPDKELQQNPRILQHTAHELQQMTQRIVKQHPNQQLQQNLRISKQHTDQTIQQNIHKTPQQLANQESPGLPGDAQQSTDTETQCSNNQKQQIVLVNSKPECHHKSTLSLAVDNKVRLASKEESTSEGSQSTEKQVKPIEDYMVTDDLATY